MAQVEEETTFSPQVVQVLTRWKLQAQSQHKPLRLHLGVDIGGTNCRVALTNENEISKDEVTGETYLQLCKFRCSSTVELRTQLGIVGEQLSFHTSTVPVSACLDAAGPILGNGTEVNVTNYVVEKQLRKVDLPATLFPANTVFVNDLAAVCNGIAALGEQGRLSEFFRPLWTPFQEDYAGIALRPINYLVMAMGTGLGSCLLISANGRHFALPTENGHVTLTPVGPSHPQYQEDKELIEYLSNKVYQGKYSIEWEDICSGRGLVRCYEFVTRNDVDGPRTLEAGEVVALALASDAQAQKALFLHYKYLFRCGQQQCSGMILKGVFLAGDNQVANDPFVSSHAGEFKEEFLNHSKREWLVDVPVYRQTTSYNLNLLGCLHVAAAMAK